MADPPGRRRQTGGHAEHPGLREDGTPPSMRQATSANWATIAERYRPPPLTA
ncbi:hypothetical protein [Streptomyces sp. NPDC000405]|uniref:hypothetical protein n=1 Tax=Streptomyces sp. NPDC000405 TaxID=3161033 RepID=UPI00398D66B4